MLVSCPEDPRLTGDVDLISKPKWRSATNYEFSGRVLLFPFFFSPPRAHMEVSILTVSLCRGAGGTNVVSSSFFQYSPGKFLALHGILSSHSTLLYFWVQDKTLNPLWLLKSRLLDLFPSTPWAARAPADAYHSVSTFFVASGHILFSLWLNQDCKMMFIIFYPTFLGILYWESFQVVRLNKWKLKFEDLDSSTSSANWFSGFV